MHAGDLIMEGRLHAVTAGLLPSALLHPPTPSPAPLPVCILPDAVRAGPAGGAPLAAGGGGSRQRPSVVAPAWRVPGAPPGGGFLHIHRLPQVVGRSPCWTSPGVGLGWNATNGPARRRQAARLPAFHLTCPLILQPACDAAALLVAHRPVPCCALPCPAPSLPRSTATAVTTVQPPVGGGDQAPPQAASLRPHPQQHRGVRRRGRAGHAGRGMQGGACSRAVQRATLCCWLHACMRRSPRCTYLVCITVTPHPSQTPKPLCRTPACAPSTEGCGQPATPPLPATSSTPGLRC